MKLKAFLEKISDEAGPMRSVAADTIERMDKDGWLELIEDIQQSIITMDRLAEIKAEVRKMFEKSNLKPNIK